MRTHIHQSAKNSLADRHVDDLIEVLGELLAVPELQDFEPEAVFDSTREIIMKARVIRSAVLDELSPPPDAAP
jgi:hypothetical protein